MNKILLPSATPIMKNYDHCSSSNPSLLTADFPSDSKIISHLVQSTSVGKQNHSLNQNQVTDTQPIMLNSQTDNYSQCTNLSNTYLNLSQQDINDVLTALHTLAKYVNYDIHIRKQARTNSMNEDDESDHSTIVCNSLSSSIRANNSSYYHQPQYLLQHRHRSLSSNRCLCRHHHHHVKHHHNSIKDFPKISTYPSYSSNAMFHASTSQSNRRLQSIHHRSLQCPSTSNLPSKEHYQQSTRQNISSHIHDKFISIDPFEPFSNIQILPQQAHPLQILENNPFNTESILLFNCKPISNSTKIDVATQWSSQDLMSSCPKMDLSQSIPCHNEQENTEIDIIDTHSSILTELSQSATALVTSNSSISISKLSLLNDLFLHQQNLTKTELEQLLTELDLSICKCSTINDTSPSIINKKRRKSTSIQRTSKRSRISRRKKFSLS